MLTLRLKSLSKALLLVFAANIALFSLLYTNQLVQKLQMEERKNMETWANAVRLFTAAPIYNGEVPELDDFFTDVNNFTAGIMQNNINIPVILCDNEGNILSHVNLDSARVVKDTSYLRLELEEMKNAKPPIIVEFQEGKNNYLYFKDSNLLTQLRYYPYYQLALISLFLLVSYLAFNASRQSEQNRVWVGLAKETAHQLGTPISSLMAWIEFFRGSNTAPDPKMLDEMEKDVRRLEIITERFSKIGSDPVLKEENIYKVLNKSVQYLKMRTSGKVKFEIESRSPELATALVSIPLFDWVIENITKNAIDAMEGSGEIKYLIIPTKSKLIIDISDTGKGIPSKHFKTIFKPGFTTKKRGWGLGLSLVKRIIESYHKGTIIVKESIPGKGTTFRIVLKRSSDI